MEIIIAGLKAAVEALVGALSKYVLNRIPQVREWWRKKFWKRRTINVSGQLATMYLAKFLSTNRCPPWDEKLCDSERIQHSAVYYIPLESAQHTAFTLNLENLSRFGLTPLLESVPQFVARIYDRMSGVRGTKKNVFVLLGGPGAGKSTVTVQMATHMACQAQSRSHNPIPVYVNLAHFDDEQQPTLEAFSSLVMQSIAKGCPRYILSNYASDPLVAEFLAQFESLEKQGAIFYILDGMDEMTTDAYSQRVKAIADFIDSKRHLGFVVTCRHNDFVTLKEYSHNFQIQRLDLLPWPRKIVNNYIDARLRGNTAKKELIRKAIFDYGQGDDMPLEGYQPQVVSLLCSTEEEEIDADLRLSRFWDRFVTKKLRRCFTAPATRDEDIENFKNVLGAIAYQQVWKGSMPPADLEAVEEIGRRAGLLRKTVSGLTFEVRPLHHFFAARELLRRVRKSRSGSLPSVVRLEDLNAREVFKSAADQAGTDREWIRAILRRLTTVTGADAPSVYGDRMAFIAACVTDEQVGASRKLRFAVATILEQLVVEGDEIGKERVLDALAARPNLLDPNMPKISIFFGWVLSLGSPAALSWLVRLLSTNRALRKKFRRVWLKAILRSLDEELLAVQARMILFSKSGGWLRTKLQRAADALLSARSLFVFFGYYLTYMAALSLANAIFSLAPALASIKYTFAITELWRTKTVSLNLVVDDLCGMLAVVYLTRYFIRGQAREGIRFRRWWTRYLTIFGIAFTYSFAWGIFVFLADNLRLFLYLLYFVEGVGLSYIIGALVAMMVTFIKDPKHFHTRVRKFFQRVGRQTSAGDASFPYGLAGFEEDYGGTKRYPIVNPSDVIALGYLMSLQPGGQADADKPPSRLRRIARHTFAGAAAVLWGGALIAVLVLYGLNMFLGLIILSVVLIVIYSIVVDQYLQVRRTKEQIGRYVRAGLRQNLIRAFEDVCKEILKEENPEWSRTAYVNTLNEVRFDDPVLYDMLEELYERMPQGTVKMRLTKVMERAMHERQKNRPSDADFLSDV